MLLPTTLPTAMSRSPRTVAMMDVATSGNDVPPATIVRPITNSLTPSSRAISMDALTSQRAPRTSRPRPASTRTTFVTCAPAFCRSVRAPASLSPASRGSFLARRIRNRV